MNPPDRTPVLVGIGTATQRVDDPDRAMEPIDLMLQAVRAAGSDTDCTDALQGAQYIAVPRGRWHYANPAGEIARAVGAQAPVTVLATVGVLQQTLIGQACARIARGEVHTAIVAGADAGYRLRQAQAAGKKAPERAQDDEPDVVMSPKGELRHPIEMRAGMQMPVGLYALMESAFRARRGWSMNEHRDRLAQLCAGFSRIAAENPHAWVRRAVPAGEIRDATERNPMQAFPYTRRHCSNWSVDQAGALLLCSAERARQLGIPRSQWVFALASTESNHMVPVSCRKRLDECMGARVAGQAALDAAGLKAQDVDLVDLYSCFPIAVQAYAQALGLPLTRDLTVTGGMHSAGGPYNNYVLQATCRAAELLRQGRGETALVSSVSGVLTKQGFGLWSMQRSSRFVLADVSDQVERETETMEVLDNYSGPARVAGCTVLHERGQALRAVVLADTPQGQRAMATSEDEALVARIQEEEFVGRDVRIQSHVLVGV